MVKPLLISIRFWLRLEILVGSGCGLKPSGCRMKYVSVFYEGEHNDARTNLCIAFTAAMYGAAISNYAKVAESTAFRFLEG